MGRIPLSAFDFFLLHPRRHLPPMSHAIFLDFRPFFDLSRTGTGLAIANGGL
jgi:hypothetical protein